MPNYAMQAEMIRWGYENGSKIYDFGGVFILDKTNGLYKFKEGFCRREGATEFIGEFDKVYNPLIYAGFAKLLPKLQRMKAKKNHHDQPRQAAQPPKETQETKEEHK